MAFYRITLIHDHRGRNIQNVFHVEESTGLMTQDFIADLILQFWVPMFDNLQFSRMLLRFIEVRRFGVPAPLAPTLLQPNRFAVGSLTGAEGNMAFKFLFRTDLAGAHHRGRYYLCGVAENLFDVGFELLGPAAIQRMTNATLLMRARFTTEGAETGLMLVIRHKDETITPTRVSNVLFSQRAHWLKSREFGHGI